MWGPLYFVFMLQWKGDNKLASFSSRCLPELGGNLALRWEGSFLGSPARQRLLPPPLCICQETSSPWLLCPCSGVSSEAPLPPAGSSALSRNVSFHFFLFNSLPLEEENKCLWTSSTDLFIHSPAHLLPALFWCHQGCPLPRRSSPQWLCVAGRILHCPSRFPDPCLIDGFNVQEEVILWVSWLQ